MSTRHLGWISQWFGRLLISIALAGTGITFFVVGFSSIVGGGPLLDFCFMGLGVIPVLVAIVYQWYGGRLGAAVDREQLIVRSYFPRHDTVVSLVGLRRIYRSVDATVLEFPDRQFALDDCYFPDSETRDRLVDVLSAHVSKHDNAEQSACT